MRRRLIAVAFLLSAFRTVDADPVVQKFQIWTAVATTRSSKAVLLMGWTNGFLLHRGDEAFPFADCLASMSTEQMVAMVDKYYTDHPGRWSSPFGDEVLSALTVAGSPCEGKNSYKCLVLSGI